MANYDQKESELLARLREEISSADYSGTNELSFQREQSTRAYNGVLTDGLEPTTGMSSLVNNKVQPVVEALSDYVARVFISDQETVAFSPTSKELHPAAKQLTKMVNHVIHKQNSGSSLISMWLKDAAVNKNSTVKVTWDETPEYFKEEYTGTEEECQIWLNSKEAEGLEYDILEKETIKEVLEISDESTGEVLEVEETMQRKLVKFSKPGGRVKLNLIAPETFLVNEGATSLTREDPEFVFATHRQMMPITDCVELARSLDVDIDEFELSNVSTEGYLEWEYETLNRHSFDGTFDYTGTQPSEGLLRRVEVQESWLRYDWDEDGIAEWRHLIVVGDTFLVNEEWFGEIPFASYTFFEVPHKFYGLSVYDKISQYHRAASMLLRSEADVRLQQNTFRIIADPKMVDMRDLMSGRPGIIKAKPGFDPKSTLALPTPSGAGNTTAILEYIDRQIFSQIGFDFYNGVVSSDVEKSGNDAAKTSQVIDAASNRVEGYARRFADGPLRLVVWQVAQLLLEHSEEEGVQKLAAKVSEGTPFILGEEGMQAAIEKEDLSAKVGLGFQTAQQKLTGAQAIMAAQQAMEASPTAPTPIPYKYKQASAMEMAKALGFENGHEFFPSPEEIEQAQAQQAQQQQQLLAAQQQMQGQQMQEEGANNESKRQLDAAKAEEAMVKAQDIQRKLDLEAERAVVDIENVQKDNDLNTRRQEAQEEQMVANLELQRDNQRLQRELAELKARTDLEKQRMADDKTIRLKKEGSSE